MKKNSTKTAFISSLIALVLTVVMLAGTTFAWFTDNVSSGENTIVAGLLHVSLEYQEVEAGETDGTIKAPVDDGDDVWKNVEGASIFGATDRGDWEPGHTEVAFLRVANTGSLALKYDIQVNVELKNADVEFKNDDNEDIEIEKYLVAYVLPWDQAKTLTEREMAWKYKGEDDGTYDEEKALEQEEQFLIKNLDTDTLTNVLGENKVLLPDGEGTSDAKFALVVYMPAWIGNEANQSLDSFKANGGKKPEVKLSITLTAKQTPYEKDTFDENYDKFVDDEKNPGEADPEEPKVPTNSTLQDFINENNDTTISNVVFGTTTEYANIVALGNGIEMDDVDGVTVYVVDDTAGLNARALLNQLRLLGDGSSKSVYVLADSQIKLRNDNDVPAWTELLNAHKDQITALSFENILFDNYGNYSLAGYTALKEINANNVNFSGVTFNDVPTGLTTLRAHSASNFSSSGLAPSGSLNAYTNLTTLDIGGPNGPTSTYGWNLSNISALTKLEYLDVSNWSVTIYGTSITDSQHKFDFPNLKTLNLNDYKLNAASMTSVGLNALIAAPKLETLNMRNVDFKNSKITLANQSLNTNYPNLAHVDFSGSTLWSDYGAIFTGCTSLEDVNLSDATVSSLSSMFKGCTNLHNVDFSNCHADNNVSMSGMFNMDGGENTALKVIDLSSFTYTSSLAALDAFSGCSGLVRIFTNGTITFSKPYSGSENVFTNCKSLKGGVGGSTVTWSDSKINYEYAKTDGGYFTNVSDAETAITEDAGLYGVNDLPSNLQQYAK